MGRLSGKIAIVTGAAKGLGEADARLFVAEGATVMLSDVDEALGQKLADELGENAEFHNHDVRDETAWQKLIDYTVNKYGRLDVLVNNAGVVAPGNIESQTADEYNFIMDVSSLGTFLGCKYAVKAMKKTGGGSIINMASVASLQGEDLVSAYCAAKGAVEGLTRAVAVHSRRHELNIRCNSIHPGPILTPMVIDIQKTFASAAPDAPPREPPSAAEMGQPNDIANVAVFLASDESSFVSGIAMPVDNARSMIPYGTL